MKRKLAFIISFVMIMSLAACNAETSDGETAEATAKNTELEVSETTAATVSETDTLSAKSDETTADKPDGFADDEVDIEPIEDETFLDMTTETEETFPAPPIPPETAEEHVYGGRSNTFLNDDFMENFEHVLWMPLTKTFVSNDNCELLYFESDEKLAYVGVEKATGENTTLNFFRKYDDEFADDPMLSADYLAYKNHLLAVGGDDVLPYFPAGASVPTNIVLFPDCGEFYYYGAATEREYENYEWHWTKSTDLGLTWKPDSDSSTVGNFYYGSDPVFYEDGVWKCGNTAIWIG